MRYVVAGTGFWSAFQIAAWREIPGVELVGAWNRTPEKARRFGVPVYESVGQILDEAKPDFLDIISAVEVHAEHVQAAVDRGIPVICQKPMGETFAQCRAMVEGARRAGVPFFIHENWRWQRPLRRVREILESGEIGRPFRGRLQFSCSFPVFDNQPFLAQVEQFILMDIGSHVLDTARSLFGEADRLSCVARRVNPAIRGEDVATVLLDFGGTAVTCEMSYASRLERESFPQTYALVEGEQGSLELGKDYEIRVTTASGTRVEHAVPARYEWADPAYDLVHSSIVDCNRDLHRGLQGGPCETSAIDNLETMRLVFASYESAETGTTLDLRTWNR